MKSRLQYLTFCITGRLSRKRVVDRKRGGAAQNITNLASVLFALRVRVQWHWSYFASVVRPGSCTCKSRSLA